MEVEEESQEYLTINTLGFSAPAIWQRSLDQILEGKEETSCILDEVIITGKDDEEQPNHLEEVLKSLKEHDLRANRDKCERKITYCGHKVDKHRLRKIQEKVDAVVNAPRPENIQQVRLLLGLVNYCHKFLPSLATTLNSLN